MNAPAVDRFASLTVGQSATRTHTVTDTDVVVFATVTGDTNPVHLDEAFARTTRFGGRIAHGMLSGGFISAIIASELPGPGSIYMTQSLRFLRPVFIGDSVTTRVEILELFETKRRVRLATSVRNQRGEAVVDGEALIMLPKEE